MTEKNRPHLMSYSPRIKIGITTLLISLDQTAACLKVIFQLISYPALTLSSGISSKNSPPDFQRTKERRCFTIQRCVSTAYQEFKKYGERATHLVLPFFRKYFEPKVQFSGNPNLDHEVLLFRILLKSNYARLLNNLLITNNITEDK